MPTFERLLVRMNHGASRDADTDGAKRSTQQQWFMLTSRLGLRPHLPS